MKTIQEKNGEVEYVLTSEEYRRLDEANQAMLAALERIADPRNTHFAGDAQVVARAAIAKGEQA